jgi:3-oxoacyl-[acyl-carrier protein] reductase
MAEFTGEVAVTSGATKGIGAGTAKRGAFDSITKSLARKLAARNLRVSGVDPGFVTTEGTRAAGMASGELEAWTVASIPPGRSGQRVDIAAAFLAFGDASWITGESLRVGGGIGM